MQNHAIYIRKSTTNEEMSLEEQKKALNSLDLGVVPNHNSFERLQEKIDNNEIDKIIFKTKI